MPSLTHANNLNISLPIYVFSYNRGVFLNNCLESIRKCAPHAHVTIIDDNSTDPATQKVLQKWQTEIETICQSPHQVSQQNGGLRYNMDLALDLAKKRRQKLVLFMQDDMQLVRELVEADIDYAEHYFYKNPDACELNVCFIKQNKQHFNKVYVVDIDQEAGIYWRTERESGLTSVYQDAGLFHVTRVAETMGHFQASMEQENVTRMRRTRAAMAHASYPFMMFLPFPSAYTRKQFSPLHRIADLIARTGFYPYECFNKADLQSFLSRPPAELPYAQEYLSCPKLPHKGPWLYGGGGIQYLTEAGGAKSKLGRLLKRVDKISARMLKFTSSHQ